jgi:L-ascorbate metabolism protein UlaG (beta-lactamase superfamily)
VLLGGPHHKIVPVGGHVTVHLFHVCLLLLVSTRGMLCEANDKQCRGQEESKSKPPTTFCSCSCCRAVQPALVPEDAAFPQLDFVCISHNHYDHLDAGVTV